MEHSLAGWQTRFLEAVRRGGTHEGLFAEPVRGPSAADRLGAYREGHEIRTRESLVEDFPLTRRLLGAAAFDTAIQAFLAIECRAYELELGELSPPFAAFLVSREGRASVGRAVRIDLLAVESRRAPEPTPIPGGGFGLHPSSRFLVGGSRAYALWRDGEGFVCRERIDGRTERLLAVFADPAGLELLGTRLEALGEEPAFVQETVAAWTECGLIVAYT